ncbi:MAG TPA: cobalamin-dependent protein [Prolixibacteraceae bacterium]|nr:cobalamin-dependent protein [Prolixibacteraceae bacterium]HPS12389.1 cobalamin-dependent protein [Prolixibacteraceae bacterium]
MEIPDKYSDELEQALLMLDRNQAEKIVMDTLKLGPPAEIAGKLLSKTLQNIGEAWVEGRIALSQEYMSSIICEELIDKILPPASPQRISQPPMAIAVFEDYHLLGKRIVLSALRASGFELLDLGGGLTADQLVEIIHHEKIEILLLSVLMLPSAIRVKELKKKLNGTNTKLIVGGAPFRFDEELWKEVGADAFGKDSSEAIEIVTKMVEEMR